MNPRARDRLGPWPLWGLPLLGAAALGTVVAGASHFSTEPINPNWWEPGLPLLGLVGGAVTGAYLGFALHTWIVRSPSVEEMNFWEPPPLGSKERQRRQLQAKQRLLETWQAQAELLEDRQARPRTQVGWLIFKPPSGAGKPTKTAAFIRRILEEIRQLNSIRTRWHSSE